MWNDDGHHACVLFHKNGVESPVSLKKNQTGGYSFPLGLIPSTPPRSSQLSQHFAVYVPVDVCDFTVRICALLPIALLINFSSERGKLIPVRQIMVPADPCSVHDVNVDY